MSSPTSQISQVVSIESLDEAKEVEGAKEVEEVEEKGLDEDVEILYVYLRHASNPKVWKIADSAATHSKLITSAIIDNADDDLYGRTEESPFVISGVKFPTMELMVSYMNYYNGKPEKCAPELPLKNIDISYILEEEYELFVNICDPNLDMGSKLVIYNDFIRSAIYFGFEYLHKKLCAIVANMFKDLSLSELKQLSSS